MDSSGIVLLPFGVVFFWVLLSHHIVSSLLLGICSIAGIYYYVYKISLQGSIRICLNAFWDVLKSSDYLYPLLFFIILVFIIELLSLSGVVAQYRRFMSKYLSSSRDLEKVTLKLSFLFFIDDYLSALSLGAFLQPLLVSYHVARVKFAFILDNVSAPLCIFIPFSSWTIMFIGQLKSLFTLEQLEAYGYASVSQFLFSILPFVFYPLAALFFVWYVVYADISFGKMRAFEEQAKEPFSVEKESGQETLGEGNKRRIEYLFFVPFGVFLSCLLVFIFLAWLKSGSCMQIFEYFDLAQAMVFSILCGFQALLGCMKYHNILGKELVVKAARLTYEGLGSSLLLLITAWVFGNLMKGLGVSELVARTLEGLTFLKNLYPFIFFSVAFFLSTLLGSVWGVIALVMPLVSLLFGSPLLLIQLTIGSLISGAFAGSHFTPLSNSVLVASTAARCKPMDHYTTQFQYAVVPLAGSFFALSFCVYFLSTFSYELLIAAGILSLLGGMYIGLRIMKIFNNKH